MERLSKTKQVYKTSHYQDVFTKAPQFGVPSLSPRIEDYAEIFGRARVATSIPFLDLPPAEVAGLSGSFRGMHFDYNEVFGGSEGEEFAVTFDELMEGSKGGVTYDSSDEAWSPAQSETLSDGSEEFHNSGDGVKQFKISYNKVFHTSEDDLVNGVAHVTQLNDVRGYSFLVSETPPQKMVVTNHLKHEDCGAEKGEGKQLRKTSSCNDKPFVSVSDISLRTQPSHLPPPSRPPPIVGPKDGDYGTKNSKIKASRSFAFGETTSGDGSPPFYDVQVDASSSAAVSAAAMKDAMEKAQAKLKIAKHMKDRSKQPKICGETSERDSRGVKEFANNATTEQEKRYGLLQESSSKNEGNVEWKQDEDFYEVVETDDSKNLSDVGYGQRFVASKLRNFEDRQEKRASPVISQQDVNRNMKCERAIHEKIIVEAEDFENMANVRETENEDEKRYRNGFDLEENTRLGGNFEGENKILKEATERAEIQIRLKETLEKEEKEKKEREEREREAEEKRLQEAIEKEENEKKLILALEEKEKKQREALEIKEKEKRDKEARERELEEKRLQEAIEKEENEKRLRLALEEKEKKQREALEIIEKEKRDKEARERELEEKRLQEAIEKEENEKRLRLALEEKEKKQREVLEKQEKEKRDKEARERELEEKRLQEAVEKEENEKRWRISLEVKEKKQREARERMEAEEREKETREREEKEKREKEAAEREAKEGRLQKSFKEKEKKQSKACESEEKVKREKEACEREVESNRLSVPIDQQEKENKLDKTLGTKENEGRQDLTLDEAEKRAKEDLRWQNNKVEPNSILEKGGNKEKIVEGCELKENIEIHEVHEREDSEKRSSEDFEDEEIDKMWEEDNWSDENVAFCKAANEVDKNNRTTKKIQGPFPLKDPTHFEVQRQDLNTSGISRDGLQHKRRDIRVAAAQSLHMHDTVFEFDKKPFKRTSNIVKVSVVDNDLGEKGANTKKVQVAKDNREETCTISKEVKEKVQNQKGERKGKHLDEVLTREEIKREAKMNRVKELENERLRKIEEEREREREREKDRMAVDKASLERAAVERATVDARLRAMAEARERLEKANAEARMKAERAAVERATAEARERALQKAKAGKSTVETQEHVERMAKSSLRSDSYQAVGSINVSTNAYSSAHRGVEVESAERCKARLERHQRTAQRAAKALEEKNMRDLLAQRELAERNRLAEGLDAEVKRWSSGKEGNLRALLSTLQYILGQNSGWKPIHLTEVITSAAVKKAYRKATLFVHPDKLQQRGASIHEKYVCEKVFDLLKAAWTKFNSEER